MRTRRLIVVTPEGDRELLFIGRLTIGRAPECDISLADTKISRQHAEFDATGPMPRVTDLGSRNGILVNGRKVGAADLVPGDVVTVGDASIRFEERSAETAEVEPAAPPVDDRTLVLSPLMPPGPPPLPAVTPPPEPMGGVPDLDLGLRPDSEKTGDLLARGIPPSALEALPFDASGERTALLPPPQRRAATARRPVDAVPARIEMPDVAPPVSSPPRFPSAVPAAPAPVLASSAPVPAPVPLSPAPAPAAAAPAAAPSAGAATGSGLQGPRFSWGGLVTLAAVLLGGLSVLLGALPLMSASSSALDALSQRQARTLAGWLAAGVDAQATTVVDPSVMEAVLAQPGVARAMVLERATGRAIAPVSLNGRAYSALPGLGDTWRDLSSARVNRVDAFADAYVPAGGGAYLVWVRYERPSSDDTGLAIMVALVATLVFAMLIALLIKRQTKATLQHFTRQVELAVSGASSKVMQGSLMPGLERLPGVVTYLLEQRRAGGAIPPADRVPGASHADGPALPVVEAPPVDPGPPWLEVTPSLMVVESSAHGPAAGATGWNNARGRHMLDVLDNGPVRNAVVQGLGALSMQSGSEATVPLPAGAPVTLRREASGHVRVTLGAR